VSGEQEGWLVLAFSRIGLSVFFAQDTAPSFLQ
jgi:hypothetical protein